MFNRTNNIKLTLVTMSLALSVFSLSAHATLTSYSNSGKGLVYSTVSGFTWTKDGNLLGSLFASQGFNTVVMPSLRLALPS